MQRVPSAERPDSYTRAPSASCRAGAGQALGEPAQSSKMQLFQAPSHLHIRGSPLKNTFPHNKGEKGLMTVSFSFCFLNHCLAERQWAQLKRAEAMLPATPGDSDLASAL